MVSSFAEHALLCQFMS